MRIGRIVTTVKVSGVRVAASRLSLAGVAHVLSTSDTAYVGFILVGPSPSGYRPCCRVGAGASVRVLPARAGGVSGLSGNTRSGTPMPGPVRGRSVREGGFGDGRRWCDCRRRRRWSRRRRLGDTSRGWLIGARPRVISPVVALPFLGQLAVRLGHYLLQRREVRRKVRAAGTFYRVDCTFVTAQALVGAVIGRVGGFGSLERGSDLSPFLV